MSGTTRGARAVSDSTSAGYGRDNPAPVRRSLPQIVSLILGLTLVAAGIAGFFADADFAIPVQDGDAGSRGELLGFEVNGWHNIVHLASGLFLLFMAAKHATARTALIIFGVIYAVVTVWGFVNGDNIFRLLPTNGADNFLHLALAAVSLLVGLTTKEPDYHRDGGSARGAY